MIDNKRKFFVIALVCFSMLTALMVFSGERDQLRIEGQDLKAIAHAKTHVSRIRIQDSYQQKQIIRGMVLPAQRTNIGFDQGGVLAAILVEDGEKVTKGDVLARLDTERLRAKKQELQAELNVAQANARIAELSLQRIDRLLQDNLESAQAYDEQRARYDAAKAQVEAVEAKLNSLQIEIKKSALVAPFTGQVVQQYQDLGAVVGSGQAIFEIINHEQLEARVGLPQNLAFTLRVGEVMPLEINQQARLAKLKFVESSRHPKSRTVDGIFVLLPSDSHSLDDTGLNILSGDLVSLSVSTTIENRGAWLPLSSLSSGVRGLWTIYVVDESTSTLRSKLVSVEYLEESRAYVSGAIRNTDLLVVSGTHRLTPNQQVKNITIVDSEVLNKKTSNAQ
ncbi:efflux RND transporter periplasmic adaptor subunit [Agaribacter flavus]|uniref:Efflux RND transporter periplasmic adaptor subunit n=1 Tax=Agaribacter flavus TaxID=1902781 RepID=A0ABV7FTH3_9ALTE